MSNELEESITFIKLLANSSFGEKHFLNLGNHETLLELSKTKKVLLKAQEQEKEIAKYKVLEDELGCPLEVVFKALKNGIYVEEGTFEKYDVRGIELRGLSVISKFCRYAECDFTCYYTDYKKTWWLKEDKSE